MDTPPLLYKSVHVTFVFWVPKTPLLPYVSGTNHMSGRLVLVYEWAARLVLVHEWAASACA